MKLRLTLFFIYVFPLCCSGCFFGPNKGPRVIGYRQGTVYLSRDGGYRVGALPDGWRRFRTGARAVAFHHDATGATISTNAFCGAAFEDLPLPALMGHLFTGFPADRVVATTQWRLDGREALRQISLRTVDGVPLQYDAVVVKKNNCTFDFVSMAPPRVADAIAPPFEAFVHGFRYE